MSPAPIHRSVLYLKSGERITVEGPDELPEVAGSFLEQVASVTETMALRMHQAGLRVKEHTGDGFGALEVVVGRLPVEIAWGVATELSSRALFQAPQLETRVVRRPCEHQPGLEQVSLTFVSRGD